MSDLNVFGFDVDDSVNINGTSLQGTVQTTYDNLVDVLGEPTYTDANPYEKVACEWTINAKVEDPDTIFNHDFEEDDFYYKPLSVYCWKTGRIPTEKYDWHIGGNDYQAVEIAEKIILG